MRSHIDPGIHLVMGISGPDLTPDEITFIKENQPAGIILFSRNIANLDQLQSLLENISKINYYPPAIWLDQEGGRVQRIRDPLTRYPSALHLAHLEQADPDHALRLARIFGELNARELASIGIHVNCAPVLDIHEPEADPVIGERAFGSSPQQVIRLAGAWLDGFENRGVLAVGKHFPGHGAARADSHKALPVVTQSRDQLEKHELVPFKALLNRLPALMTAHLIATGLDKSLPATWSAATLEQLLRRTWQYNGLIVSDALEMGALTGTMTERTKRAMLAGCDMVLCCTGRLEDAQQTLEGIAQAREQTPCIETTRHRIQRAFYPLLKQQSIPLHTLLDDEDYQLKRNQLEIIAQAGYSVDPTEPTTHPS
ncbi:MAG: beta-N-acetylhexosaminidase [Magnetococcales bacterium]|nr:beta-N-acetylhexosaminidase [Magnetococcales bacterium]